MTGRTVSADEVVDQGDDQCVIVGIAGFWIRSIQRTLYIDVNSAWFEWKLALVTATLSCKFAHTVLLVQIQCARPEDSFQ